MGTTKNSVWWIAFELKYKIVRLRLIPFLFDAGECIDNGQYYELKENINNQEGK